jgi:hypothetical protein
LGFFFFKKKNGGAGLQGFGLNRFLERLARLGFIKTKNEGLAMGWGIFTKKII